MASSKPRRRKTKRKQLRVRERANFCNLHRVRGQNHPKANLTDHEVDLVLELRSEGFTYYALSVTFETPKSTIRDICKGLTRARCG